MKDDDLNWQQQAEVYQLALESALAYQEELELNALSQESQITFYRNDIIFIRERYQEMVRQRDQVIADQAKELEHLRHILQVQQQLLRVRQ